MAVLDTKGQELAALSALLDRALELPDGERTRWIGSLPPEHGQLRPRLERMLSASRPGVTSRFLETIPKVHSGSVDEHAAFEHAGAPDERMPPSAEAGPYRIARKIADGGMGTVWLAYRTDVMVNRPVALKLPRRAFHSGQLAARIAEEREILAALNHPNIARLYDAGIAAGGQPYLALEYVEGRPIDEFVAARKQTIPARLRLFLLVARAVAHAHGRLVVHRDLKPSNIMVTEEGDVKLLDFGIAKLLDDGRFAGGGNAESSARLLTPDYASPEQLAGEPLGVATDVYSSGIVLYELLTGTRPSLDERLAAGRRPGGRAQPGVRPPSTVARDPATRRALLGDLDAIVLKAIAERPEERYATIGLLADDIDRYLQHQPVLARRATLRYRAAKYIARNTVAVAAAVAVLAATLAGTGLAAWQAHVALREKAHAVEVRDFLTTLFRDASPYNSGQRAMSALDWLKHARARVDRGLEKRPALRVEMLNIVGASLLNLQDTDAADEVLTQAIAEGTRRLGPDHPATIRARVLMTPVHRYRGRTREMRAELATLIPTLRAAKRDLPEDLVIALKNQAHLDIDDGRYQAAETAAQEAVDVGVETLGREHPETVAALLTRAYAFQYSRPPDAALAAAEEAYQTAVAVFRDAPTHPRTIEGRLLYGRALGEAGQPARGVEQLTQAVADAAAVFGPTSRMVGFFSLPLAAFQLETGQVADSLDHSRKALEIIARHTKPQSFRFAAALHQRGASLLAARRPAEALPDLSRATATLKETLPPGHAVTRWFQADEALALARSGRHREAEALAEALLAGAGPATSLGSRARYALGVSKRLSGDAEAALREQRAALTMLRAGSGATTLEVTVLTEIGLALLDLGRPAEATTALEQARDLSRPAQTHLAPDGADILMALGRAAFARGQIAQGCRPIRAAREFWRDFDDGTSEARAAARWLSRCQGS